MDKSSRRKMIYHQIKTISWVHYKVRKHYFLLTLAEICLPIWIFTFVTYGRSTLLSLRKEYVPPTYNEQIPDSLLARTINVRDTKVLFAPYTVFTHRITRSVQLKLDMYNEAVVGFQTKEDILKYYQRHGDEGITVIINFEGIDRGIPNDLQYNLQMYEQYIDWQTERLYRNDILYTPGSGSTEYIGNQFLAFQWALDTSYIEILTNSEFNISMNFQELPYPPYWKDNGMEEVFVQLLPLVTVLCYTFLFPSILKPIVEEKSSGMKQLMKINGLKSWAYWFGWFFNACSISCISALAITFLLTHRIFHEELAALQHVQFAQLAALLLLFCSATIGFIFAFSALFKNAILAMIIGITFWCLSYMMYVAAAVKLEVIPLYVKYLCSLLPHITLFYGFDVISVGELRGRPVRVAEQPRASDDDITMFMALIMLLIDTILYLLVAIFFETDVHGEYRICKTFKKIGNLIPYTKKQVDIDMERETDKFIQEDFGSTPILQIKNLTKKYGRITALNNLNLNIYERTLTVLLGHNGAGKTTTMLILAGLENKTSGELVMCETDFIKNRQLTSICPQENMLLPELSVKDHLIFFGMLKGLPEEEIKDDVEHLLKNKLNMNEKRNELIKNLSGGMKRKLSIGIAIMGRPKLLVLDEPTAGVDPEGRRDIWDMLLTCKNESSIIISTHLMEEADELAEHVAIIANGSLVSYGTPMYLKEKYGVGYHLRFKCDDSSKVNTIKRLFEEKIASGIECSIIENKSNIVEYCINGKCNVSSLLSKIDGENSLPGYEIWPVSLEDVFLKSLESRRTENFYLHKKSHLCRNDTNEYTRNIQTRTSQTSSKNTDHSRMRNFLKNTLANFLLILETKLKFLLKSKPTWFSMVALFHLLFILTFSISGGGYKDMMKDGKTIQLQLETYGHTNVYYSTNWEDTTLRNIYDDVVKASSSIPHNTNNVSNSIIERGTKNIAEYMIKLVVGTEIIFKEGALKEVNVMYSNQAIHGAPISLNLINNVLVKYLTREDHSIIAYHTPLHAVKPATRQTKLYKADNLPYWMILLPTGCIFSVIMFTALPTLERSNLMIMLSRIYGLSSTCYWIANYIIDVITYIITIIPAIVILSILSICSTFVMQSEAVVTLVGILLWYGVTTIPHTYLTTISAKSMSTAFAKFIIPNVSVSPILAGIIISAENTYASVAKYMLYQCTMISPQVILIYTLYYFCVKIIDNHNWDMKSIEQKEDICYFAPVPCCDPETTECKNDKAYIQKRDILLFSFIMALFIMIFMIWFDREKKNCESSDSDTIKVKQIDKLYKPWCYGKCVKAVNKLSFNVVKGECFGLLGINGAGKTTSFRLITNQEKLTGGHIFAGKKALIGYCPQDHAMLGMFTGKEVLQHFGKLRNSEITNQEIQELLKKCGLFEIRNRPCGTYSGGNKRKLNTCIGLIGDPDIITLDEPTTGVDPENRRKIRDLITETKQKRKSSIIFTSHCMDDCEKLCDKVGIMRGGKIVTGDDRTIRDIKKSFNVGYVGQIKLKENDIVSDIQKLLKGKNWDILENRNKILKVSIKDSEPISSILKAMEKLQAERDGIIDYAVQKCSLEQVFLKVAKDQGADV